MLEEQEKHEEEEEEEEQEEHEQVGWARVRILMDALSHSSPASLQ